MYGGVNLQPRINIIQGGNGPLGGSRVGGGSFNRTEVTKGFQDHHIVSNTNAWTKNHQAFALAGMKVFSLSQFELYILHITAHNSRSQL